MEQKQRHPAWRMVGAVETGRAHIQEGIVCQDKICILNQNGVLTAALADGCGSAKIPEIGAEAVTRKIAQLFCARFGEYMENPSGLEVKQEILRELYEVLDSCCLAHDCTREDLASTLLAVAVRGDSYLILHIGDGVIGYVKDGRIRVASVPENGEHANETVFVTAPDACRSLRISKGTDREIEGFVLMSDGCEASLYNRQSRHLAPILARLVYRLGITSEEFIRPRLEESMTETLSRNTMDDCSLILAAKVLRGYRDLDQEELDDYFVLEELAPDGRSERRDGYVKILDLLEKPASVPELARQFGDAGDFEQTWLEPLAQIGYIRSAGDDMYVRTVHPVTDDCVDPGNAENADGET